MKYKRKEINLDWKTISMNTHYTVIALQRMLFLFLNITSKKYRRDLNADFDKFFLIPSSKLSFYVKEIHEYTSSCRFSLSLSLSTLFFYFKMTNASGSIVLTSSFFFKPKFLLLILIGNLKNVISSFSLRIFIHHIRNVYL